MTSALVLRLRTRSNLLELLQAGASGNWKVAQGKENEISKVQIFNWDGSLMLEASLDLAKTRRIEDGRLIVGLSDADAKITKCNPLLKWTGQNSVRYVNEAEESQGDEIGTAETLTELPHFAPDESEENTQVITQLCESMYGEPISLISWQNIDDGDQLNIIFRERRRGWYFDSVFTKENGKWVTDREILPSFLPIIEPDETVWSDLTNSATQEDWRALDLIFFLNQFFPDSKLYLAAGDMIGEEVAEQSLEKFGFYVPDEELLPAFLFENSRLNIRLLSYFKDRKGFGRENLLCDPNGCGIIRSLSEASEQLQEKLSHYSNQGS